MSRGDRKPRATGSAAPYHGYPVFEPRIEALLPSSPDRIAIIRASADGGSGGICRAYRQFAGTALAGMSRAYTARRTYELDTHSSIPEEDNLMLWTIFVILLVLWAVGMVSSYTLGGFIHLLLLIAIAVVLIRIIQGRRPV
jgi:hypothetical protein